MRDLTFPGELKKIFTQVVKARQEGLAALEKARGETAALRNLANAAQMVERNPALIQLRLLQVLASSRGTPLSSGCRRAGRRFPCGARARRRTCRRRTSRPRAGSGDPGVQHRQPLLTTLLRV